MTRAVIFTLGDWSVCRMVDHDYTMNIRVFANHITCDGLEDKTDPDREKSLISWLVVDEDPVCYACEVKVPDEIQALMQLHEWDKKGKKML